MITMKQDFERLFDVEDVVFPRRRTRGKTIIAPATPQ